MALTIPGSISNVYFANLSRIWVTSGTNVRYYNYQINSITTVTSSLGTIISMAMINTSTLLLTTSNNNYVLSVKWKVSLMFNY